MKIKPLELLNTWRASLWGPVSAMARTVRRFRDDRHGATAVQAMVMMPVIIVALIASSMVWQAISVRRSFHTGTYLGMRFLSLYPLDVVDNFAWADVAKRFVLAELKNNQFVDQTRLNDINPRVIVTLRDSNECGDRFDLETEYDYFGLGRATDYFLPNLTQYTFKEKREGVIVCAR